MKVTKLTRNPKSSEDIFWDPDAMTLDISSLEGIDAVVHLAGENISNAVGPKNKRLKFSRAANKELNF